MLHKSTAQTLKYTCIVRTVSSGNIPRLCGDIMKWHYANIIESPSLSDERRVKRCEVVTKYRYNPVC